MNQTDKNPDYKKMYEFVKSKFKSSDHFYFGPHDETYYTLRVYETAKKIISKLDKEIKIPQVLVAAILHDIGKIDLDFCRVYVGNVCQDTARDEWDKHPLLSVPIAQKYLKGLGHSNEFVTEVCYLIKHHDCRGDKMDFRSIELQILQDADLIADCGFAGFIRPFLYGAKFSRSVISTIKYLQSEPNRVMEKGFLNLEVSKQITKQKIAVEQKLIKEIAQDLKSDLL